MRRLALVVLALATFVCVAPVTALLCSCTPAVDEGDRNFQHILNLSTCEQEGRQAAYDVGGGSKAPGGSDAGDVAAWKAYRACKAREDGGSK